MPPSLDPPLDPVELRVLGSLLEKEITTPEYYPLSLNALTNACNQKSNREPVVDYSDGDVQDALERLKARGLAFARTGAGSRVEKYGHRLQEQFNFPRGELAVLGVLMLRGPQTPGELRGRSERMHRFNDLEQVERALRALEDYQGRRLVQELAREAGSREPRWAQLLSGEPQFVPAGEASTSENIGRADRIAALESELARLREEFDAFRREYEAFRAQF